MKASELRIGNWFKTNQEVFNPREQVASKIEAAGHINDYHESFCEPIPLTEEWLLKFGFNTTYADRCFKKKLSDTQHSMYITFTTDNPILTIGDAYTTKEYLSVFTKNLVQYVHQLQNLYFALTGEELELKMA